MTLFAKIKGLFTEKTPSESRLLACALTFSGGFVDCYTFVQRGHTLSAEQTANVIFFGESLVNDNLEGMFTRGSTFLAFSIGLLMVGLFHKYVKNNYWRVFCLFPILLVCLIVSFLPASVPNYLIVPAISFSLALQNASFSKIEGMAYSNAFTTGNLSNSVIAWSAYFFGAEKVKGTAARNYMWLVIAFALGAIVSACLQRLMHLRTILIGAIIISIINLTYIYMLKHQRNYNFKGNNN